MAEGLGIFEQTQFAYLIAPIVPVLKKDKVSSRNCGEFKQTVNHASKLDHYKIPIIEYTFAKFTGDKLFTELELSQAY